MLSQTEASTLVALTNTENMPRQSFLSTDFFVATSEENALKALAAMPEQNSQVQLVKGNNLVHTTRFSFEHSGKTFQTYIDVSVLPLDDQYVRFCLHGFYANEKRIEDNTEIALALSCFEKLLYTVLKIDYPVKEKKQKANSSLKNIFRLPSSFLSMLRLKEA